MRDKCRPFGSSPGFSMRLSDASMVLMADLPGFSRENLSLEVDGRTLFIKGRMPDADPGVPVHLERRHGDFEIWIPLPGDLDPSRMTASLRDGVLEVSCPLGARSRKISVAPGAGPSAVPGSPSHS